MNKLTLKQVRAELRAVGMVIRSQDGEYRVTFSRDLNQDAEASACYTDDLEDALGTGKAMARALAEHCDRVIGKVALALAEKPSSTNGALWMDRWIKSANPQQDGLDMPWETPLSTVTRWADEAERGVELGVKPWVSCGSCQGEGTQNLMGTDACAPCGGLGRVHR